MKFFRERDALTWALGAFFPLALLLLHRFSLVQAGDTDRFFHFALSREMAAQGVWYLKALPQLATLGWSEFFPDKEFFFHVLTGLGFRVGGELGAQLIILATAAGAALFLYAIALREHAPLTAFGVVLAALFARSITLRLLFLRPHVLAVCLFLFLSYALLRRSRRLTALAAGLYMLSYHAFYIPLACLGITAAAAAFAPREERKALWRLAGFGLGGMALGILVNPAFPGSLVMSWICVRIPFLMHGELRNIGFGGELFPLSTIGFLQFYWFPIGVLVAALYQYGRIGGARAASFAWNYSFAVTAFFFWLATRSVRGGEYLMPAAGILFACLLARVTREEWKRALALGVGGVQALILVGTFFAEARVNPDERETRSAFAAIARIPANEKGLVFNCDWDRGAFLYYARPDLAFVSVLDPSLLYFRDAGLFARSRSLVSGLVADAQGALRDDFHADFVLCSSGPLVEQLKSDPGFQQLYPLMRDYDDHSPAYSLFRVRKTRYAQFVREYSIRPARVESAAAARKLSPYANDSTTYAGLESTTYLDLGARVQSADALRCAFVAPSPAESIRLAGAELLGLGGQQALRVWWNGELLFAGGGSYPYARTSRTLIRLPRPWSPNDRLDVLACAGAGTPWGVSLGAWKESEVAAICADKRAADPESVERSTFTASGKSCLGEVAIPRISPALSPLRDR